MTWLLDKLKAYLAVAGAIMLALGYAFLRGRKSGAQSTVDTINRETQKVDAEFQKIDSARPDFDRAITNLRNRATKR